MKETERLKLRRTNRPKKYKVAPDVTRRGRKCPIIYLINIII